MDIKQKEDLPDIVILSLNLRAYFGIWILYFLVRKLVFPNPMSDIGNYLFSIWFFCGFINSLVLGIYLNKYKPENTEKLVKHSFIAVWLCLTIILFEIIVFI
jgi:hypothetical protein